MSTFKGSILDVPGYGNRKGHLTNSDFCGGLESAEASSRLVKVAEGRGVIQL